MVSLFRHGVWLVWLVYYRLVTPCVSPFGDGEPSLLVSCASGAAFCVSSMV